MSEIENPRVFISYSWTDKDHMDWVTELAERLVNDGIDTVLDIWDFKEGHDKYAFMERMVSDPTVHKVLAICDKVYAEKADGRLGGVGTETQIISKSVYESVTQEKFIPIVRERDENGKEFLPIFFQNRKYIDFSDDDNFEAAFDQLTRMIFGKPERVKPPLGKRPQHLLQDDAPFVKTAGKLNRLKDAVQRGKPHGQALLQEYFVTFVDALEDFRIKYDRSNEPFDEVVYQSICSFRPYRDTFIELVFFIANYMDEPATYDKLFWFLESLIPFQSSPDNVGGHYDVEFDNYRFFSTEIFLSLIAALTKSKKYAIVGQLMDHRYSFPRNLNGNHWQTGDASVFNKYVKSINEIRKNRLNLSRLSLAADILGEQVNPRLPIRDIIQADMMLMVRSSFPFQEGVGTWYPRSPLWKIENGKLELFAKAVTPQGFIPLQTIFNVKSFREFVTRLNQFFSQNERLASFEFESGIIWSELFNLRELIEIANKQR